jgi:hypothetical protein
MNKIGNPLKETAELFTLDTKCVAHPSAAALVAELNQRGKSSFQEFLKGLEEVQDCKFVMK